MPKNQITFVNTDEAAESVNLHHTLFDDVFKTICTYMLPLLVPLVNELFGTDYKMDKEELERYANEHMKLSESNDTSPKVSKIISDTYIHLNGVLYHVECQSTDDGNILIRILDYNMRIAFDNAEHDKSSKTITVQLPHSAILMLKKSSDNEPRKTEQIISYIYESQKINVTVPVMHVQAYSMNEVFEKKLYFLIPFYALRYENKLDKIAEGLKNATISGDSKKLLENQTEYDKIYSDLKVFANSVYDAFSNHDLSEHYIRELVTLYQKVVNLVGTDLNDEMREGLVNTMDGQVLELACQRWYREGREAEMINTQKEKERADSETLRANTAEAKLNNLEVYVKELEEKLRAQQNTNAGNANTTN